MGSFRHTGFERSLCKRRNAKGRWGRTDARLLVLGGEPLSERIEMWWNFVARDKDEVTSAWRDWQDRTDRFGPVGSPLARIEAPRPLWVPATDPK